MHLEVVSAVVIKRMIKRYEFLMLMIMMEVNDVMKPNKRTLYSYNANVLFF